MPGTKPKILILIDWFLPGTNAGGPVRSVHALVMHLREEFDFFVLTTDTDLGENEPYPDIQRQEWIDKGDYHIKYLPKAGLHKRMIESEISREEYHRIYLNSLYSKWFTIYPLEMAKKRGISHKIVLAPRGMLGRGAMMIKSTKKKLFLSAAKAYGLFREVSWHATGEHEKRDIQKKIRKEANVVVAPNLSWFPVAEEVIKQKVPGELKLFYLSRVARVKNLHYALEVLKEVPEGMKITYHIYGPKEDADYWKECERIIQTLPAHVRVEYKDTVKHENLPEILKQYHALFLPTTNENFGHAIIESMACGCPVLISDQTPWRKLADDKSGFDLPLQDSNDFLIAIKQWATLDALYWNTWANGALRHASGFYNNPDRVKAYKELFQ